MKRRRNAAAPLDKDQAVKCKHLVGVHADALPLVTPQAPLGPAVMLGLMKETVTRLEELTESWEDDSRTGCKKMNKGPGCGVLNSEGKVKKGLSK